MITIPGRIPIHIAPIFWLLVGAIAWMSGGGVLWHTLLWVIVIFVSVLIHEYGHALTALAFGQEAHIELVGLGGVTQRHGPKLKLWQEFIIVLNGPLAGVLLFLAAWWCLELYGGDKAPLTATKYLLIITVNANIFWTILNLLPIHPLDGGRLVSIILESILGMRGVKIALFLSSIFAICISIFFFLISSFIGGAIFMLLAFESYRAWKSMLGMTVIDHSDEMQQLFKSAKEDIMARRDSIAQEKLEHIRTEAKKGPLYNEASEYLAALLNRQGLFREASAVLNPLKSKLSAEGLRLLQQAAYHNEDWKEAADIGQRAYQVAPSYDIALLNAFCYSHMGDPRPAVGWLHRALSDGLPNLKAILRMPEFDNIRYSAPFQELTQKHI